jgi:hypothetical protein
VLVGSKDDVSRMSGPSLYKEISQVSQLTFVLADSTGNAARVTWSRATGGTRRSCPFLPAAFTSAALAFFGFARMMLQENIT